MFGGVRGRLPRSLWVGALVGVMGIAGCAGDDSESTAKGERTIGVAGEPSTTFVKRMAKLLETSTAKKDCAELEQINAHSYTRFACPSPKSLRKSMSRFELVGAAEYGTGAVVDYKSGTAKDGAAILLFVAPDRQWGVSRFGLITEPSTATDDDDSVEGYEKAVDEYLAAVRRRDCKAFQAVAFLGEAQGKEACETLFAGTRALAKRLKANPSAKPKYEGGNGTYGIFTLETKKPRPENSTISVVKAAVESATKEYAVLDVAPSPTNAEQRRIREQLKKQLRQKKTPDQPKPSPSRKADPPPAQTS